MTDVSQVETNVSFEPRTPPVNPSDGNRPNRAPEPSSGGREDAAFSVDISSEAQQLSSGSEPAQPAPGGQGGSSDSFGFQAGSSSGFDTSFETSATDGIDQADGSGSNTNQVTSFESERTGNGPRNTSEATRTLGQVVDTFA
jgi:hypothetical protein